MLFRQLFTCLFFLFPFINVAQSADAYHWIDENGRPHFGDSYTPGAKVIELEPQKPNAEQLKVHQKRQQLLQQALHQQTADRHQQETEQKRAATKREKDRSKNLAECAKLKTRLENLQARWEIRRRQGYKTQDKRNYLQKRERLAGQLAASCR